MMWSRLSIVVFAVVALFGPGPYPGAPERHLLYVAVPGVRNYVEHGGVGILVFDINEGHRFVKRIPTFETRDGEAPEAIKGIAASAKTGRLYITTIKRLVAIDLKTERILWNREYAGGCDRLAIARDGKLLYVPSASVRSATSSARSP